MEQAASHAQLHVCSRCSALPEACFVTLLLQEEPVWQLPPCSAETCEDLAEDGPVHSRLLTDKPCISLVISFMRSSRVSTDRYSSCTGSETVSFTKNSARIIMASVTAHQRLRFPIQSLLHQLDDVLFCFKGLSKVLFTYTTIAVYTTSVSLLLLVLLAA